MDENYSEKFTRCILCSNFNIQRQCFNIFSTTLEKGSVLLSDFLKNVLNCSVLIVVSPEFFICKRCFSLCSELNISLYRCKQLQQEIQSLFKSREDNQNPADDQDLPASVKSEVVSEDDVIYAEVQDDLYYGLSIGGETLSEDVQPADTNSVFDYSTVKAESLESQLFIEPNIVETEIVISQNSQPEEEDRDPVAATKIIGDGNSLKTKDAATSNVWLCKGCRMIFGSEECLEDHKNKCEGEIRQLGIKSSVEFKHYSVKLKKRKKVFFCNHCSYETYTSISMQNHISCHKTDPSIMCELCGKRFKYKKTFKRHLLLHDGSRPFACKQCSFRGKTELDIQVHEKRHDDSKKYYCSKCSYKSTSKVSLNIHMRSHTGERPYCCPECPYKAKDKSTLLRHRKIHGGIKRYHCTICDYKALQKIALERHMLIHTGEKPHVCSHCDYASTVRHNLLAHIANKHPGDDAPFKCPLCNYKTKIKRLLTYHSRKHSDERPFPCQQCDYKAKYRSALYYHVRTRHPVDGKHPPGSRLVTQSIQFQGESVLLSDDYGTDSEGETLTILITP